MTEFAAPMDTFIAGLGLEAYRVGGSVRDEILGRRIKDLDYMIRGANLTDMYYHLRAAAPDDGKITPLRLRDGRQAGWRVHIKGVGFAEIVLPRKEVSTGPGHRDFEIVLDPNLTLEEDSTRRDFTFNALYRCVTPEEIVGPEDCCAECMFGAEEQPLFDPTGRGLDDLRHKRVNVTHADSFRDDPLRILRALRFVSTLDYELGPETRFLMEQHADAVTGLTIDGNVSGTVFDELNKLLMGACPAKALRIARDAGVLKHVLPELAPMIGHNPNSRYHDMTTDDHTFKALEVAAHVDAPQRVRWALLFHDAGKPFAQWTGEDGRSHFYAPSDERWERVKWLNTAGLGWTPGGCVPLERAKPLDHEVEGVRIWQQASGRLTGVPRTLRWDVSYLIRDHMVPCQKARPAKVRRERVRLGDDMLRDLYLMRACDYSAKNKVDDKPIKVLREMESIRQSAAYFKVPASVKDLGIGGRDLIELGIEGKEIGRVLAAVLDEVVAQPTDEKREREWLLKAAQRHA